MTEEHAFRFHVLGRYRTKLPQNEPHVTVHVQAGREGRFVHCGTLTLSEPEWQTLIEALSAQLGERVEVADDRD